MTKIKVFVILIFIQLSILSFAQNPFKWEEVVVVDSTITKDELFSRARKWFQTSFESDKAVLSIIDKESGEISGNATLKYDATIFYMGYVTTSGYVKFNISLYLKKGRYKYVFSNFIHEGTRNADYPPVSFGVLTDAPECPLSTNKDPRRPKAWIDIKEVTNSKIELLILDLKKSMSEKYEPQKSW